jgi:hypothetical protein
MPLSDEELTIYAIREAQLILGYHIHPVPRGAERTINEMLSVLDRDDVVQTVVGSKPALGYGWLKRNRPYPILTRRSIALARMPPFLQRHFFENF